MLYRVSRLFAKNSGIVGLLSILFSVGYIICSLPPEPIWTFRGVPFDFYPGIAARAAISSFWSPEWIGSRLSASVTKSEGKTKALRLFPKRFLLNLWFLRALTRDCGQEKTTVQRNSIFTHSRHGFILVYEGNELLRTCFDVGHQNFLLNAGNEHPLRRILAVSGNTVFFQLIV